MKTISVVEAAQRLQVSDETIRRMIATGELKASQVRPGVRGSPWEVTVASVEQVIENRRQQLR